METNREAQHVSRIVIDAREYTTSTGRYMYRLLQYLDQIDTATPSGHDYVILLKPRDMSVYDFVSPRFSKVVCPHKEFSFDEQLGLLGQIKDLKPDLVHFGMVQQPIGYRGKVVTTMQDLTTIRFRNPSKNQLVFRLKQAVYKGVNKYVARKSAAIITISEFVKQDLVQYTHAAPDKISVTYESADAIPDAAQPVDGLSGTRFIMYVGRPLPHKNLGRLIDAYALLKLDHPDLQLVLAGKTDPLYEAHYDEVLNKQINGVVFTGFVSEGQLRWLYENCQAYVFPSLSEGFGLPGLEAIIHGAPVVCSNATCLPEVYGDGAHYFDPLSIPDMSRAIAEVLDDSELRAALVGRGKIQVTKYSWLRMAQQTLAVYNDVLNSK